MAAPPSLRRVVSALLDELVEEILLRIPPDDPASLLSAALVCKSWCRLVTNPIFNRRFHEHHHHTPPLLGFLCKFGHTAGPFCYRTEGAARFFPAATTTFRRLPRIVVAPRWHAVDALRGRILFFDWATRKRESTDLDLFVCNPMVTGAEVRRLPTLVPHLAHRWSAGLLCAAPAGCSDGDDHAHADDDCPFRVVVVSANPATGISSAYVYSSEQHSWTAEISIEHNYGFTVPMLPSARIGNDALYFFSDGPKFCCLEYRMSTQQLSLISLPSEWELPS
ncbi:hypothetical protein PR202_ga28548 [Eleusine coracana subsp. coracana]|uniref:F-box domain-containing protein n=1 Tax=Eleusine coracana subsp. coracana TaxID=191504 RepID=A0AAV5DHE7_ELECO|nr:hypothetical protein QOZ80_7AG0553530 [Eleusine coracana subsp. coracana]GJN10454.1 hypothetical protein PR202_ga28548 [Eleusine coracana subsp. coracana]